MKTITINVPDDFKVPDGYEVQIVKKEPTIKTYQDLIDNKIEIKGYFIDTISRIIDSKSLITVEHNKNIAESEKVAKSMLAMAMISQLMPYYGGEITQEEWNKEDDIKYVINKIYNDIKIYTVYSYYNFLAFHTAKQRDEFLKNNKQLVKDYLMID